MADEPKGEVLQNPIPGTLPDDHEDVSWALSTARTTWDRGEHMDALKWLRRAAEAASEAEADDRALQLAKAAADLTTRIDELGWESGSARPPPPSNLDLRGLPKPTVRLSPIVVPAAPPAPRESPRPPPASPQAFRASSSSVSSTASVATGPSSSGTRTASGAIAPPTRAANSTGSSLLGNAPASGARPPRPSLGLLGPRPSTSSPLPKPPPVPVRGSRPPTRTPPPPPPPVPDGTRLSPALPEAQQRAVTAPPVIEAISSKNLVSVSMPQAGGAESSRMASPVNEEVTVVAPSPLSLDRALAAELGTPTPLAPRAPSAPSAPPPAPTVPSASQIQAAAEGSTVERTTRPAGAWDEGLDENNAFAPTPVYPSGPESVTFVEPNASFIGRIPTDARGEALHAPTAPPASSSAIENILRNATFQSTEDMESWPTEAIAGNDLPNFSFDDATKTRIGQPAYREEAGSSGRVNPDTTVEANAARPYDAESRIAARGPAQKPSQAVRVVVWRGPDGVHVAPHGTTVTAISVDALLVALDPSADLFAWLTNK